MFITTTAQYRWDKDKKEYVEVYTEGYEHNGEVALAHTDPRTHTHTYGGITEDDAEYAADVQADSDYGFSSGNQGSPTSYTAPSTYGSREWDPSESDLMDASGEDIASGFGLDEGEYGMYFQDFDPWRTELAGTERDIATSSLESKYGDEGYETKRVADMYASKLTGLQRQGAEAGKEFGAAMGTASSSMQSNWLDTSGQLAARTAQSGFTGAGRGRKGRQVQQDLSRSFTEMTSGSERAYDAMIGDLSQQTSELGITKDYDEAKMTDIYDTGMDTAALDYLTSETEDRKNYIDEIYDMLGQLASSGAWDD